MSGVGAARCTANPRLSVGLGRGGGAPCLLSPPCTRTARPAGARQRSRPHPSPHLADGKVGPQRSKVQGWGDESVQQGIKPSSKLVSVAQTSLWECSHASCDVINHPKHPGLSILRWTSTFYLPHCLIWKLVEWEITGDHGRHTKDKTD